MISFDSEICTDQAQATTREWLETNGIGGFASGTISGINTRRYHGLLTAATKPPLGRVTMLSKLEETLFIDGQAYELSANQYPGAVIPQGYKYLKWFRLDPFPIWIYEIAGVEVEKSIFLVHGSNTLVCQWSLPRLYKQTIELEVRPLVSFADYHSLQHEDPDFNGEYSEQKGLISLKPYDDQPEIYFSHNAHTTAKTGFWYRNFEYAIEKERGFDYHEDLFQPFSLKFDLADEAVVMASTEKMESFNPSALRLAELGRRNGLVGQAKAKTDFHRQLVLAADQFIVKRGSGETVIAGYPWFSDWGRDTMIALPGLTLSTNRHEIARHILLEFSKHVSEGMLPNRFPDADEEAEYNTIDATLWYFEAIRAYAEKTGDYNLVRKKLYDKLVEIIARHVFGTRYQIHVDEDGLLYGGEPGVQLTWMDARIGDWVVTPRQGKAVEIQALWYNALCIMEDFAARFGDKADCRQYQAMAEKAQTAFNDHFWNAEEECLYDVIDGENKDGSVRPNQIFAVSLPHTMVSAQRAQKIVKKVEGELLTPVGLRSLSPRDKAYRPIYTGSPLERDSAYHQGTVWAWLIGPFIDAFRKINSNSKKTEAQVANFLHGFEAHLTDEGIGQISEIFDAEPPHRPRGCMAQAWSVAEVLRVLRQ